VRLSTGGLRQVGDQGIDVREVRGQSLARATGHQVHATVADLVDAGLTGDDPVAGRVAAVPLEGRQEQQVVVVGLQRVRQSPDPVILTTATSEESRARACRVE
jgi:hypothetical protein